MTYKLNEMIRKAWTINFQGYVSIGRFRFLKSIVLFTLIFLKFAATSTNNNEVDLEHDLDDEGLDEDFFVLR